MSFTLYTAHSDDIDNRRSGIMHRPVCITYDSTCDLTPALLERFGIRTVPLTIQSG